MIVYEKKENGLITILSGFGLVKTLLNWSNNEQHISYLFIIVVVVCLPRPMEGMGRLQFSDLFSQNCQFHHRRLESLEHLMCLIYILLSTTVSHFLDLTDAFFFTRSSFLYKFPFCKYSLHVCYVFNVLF